MSRDSSIVTREPSLYNQKLSAFTVEHLDKLSFIHSHREYSWRSTWGVEYPAPGIFWLKDTPTLKK